MSAGDWNCPNMNCMNSHKKVFASKQACPKCGSRRPGTRAAKEAQAAAAAAAAATVSLGTADHLGAIASMMSPQMIAHAANPHGDWQCPNVSCINNQKMVFGKNTSCPSCGTAKNATRVGDWLYALNRSQSPSSPSQGKAPVMAAAPSPFVPFSLAAPAMPAMAIGGQAQMNDWQCPNSSCINHMRLVFQRHTSCPQCGEEKPSAAALPMRGQPGDWQCPNPDCINNRKLVFGSKATCPNCGSEKPNAMENGRGRSRSPYGR
eukprot:gnl/TRDRNA2_/TRDRNA2_165490_c4_seq3.p1 gnl/TRDRNA2_/TRDRNA2_165490_c4~~gnl/TRDRNA2_/TRDRNA2_165490_c4_seq3.p1  ORF type:complete len:285 (-),score=21.01 gnl/TRDRNA2_/TRDRNA2_165490_c4_seq3:56-841(-)